jgi:uncharacterized phage protein (TIGR01671 family)
MRENLFRGKRIDNGEWVYGDLLNVGVDYDYAIRTYGGREHGQVNAVDEKTVGQYTGLTDKNGKKIFEGDVVHYLYEPGKGYWNSDQNSVIEWRSTGFYMDGIFGTNKYACSSGWLVSIPHGDGKCFEVIGNIHDNPELLKGEQR